MEVRGAYFVIFILTGKNKTFMEGCKNTQKFSTIVRSRKKNCDPKQFLL